jgi:hypothetical protein
MEQRTCQKISPFHARRSLSGPFLDVTLHFQKNRVRYSSAIRHTFYSLAHLSPSAFRPKMTGVTFFLLCISSLRQKERCTGVEAWQKSGEMTRPISGLCIKTKPCKISRIIATITSQNKEVENSAARLVFCNG